MKKLSNFRNLFSSVSKLFFVRKRFIKGNNEIGIVYEKCFELLEDN